MHQAVYWYCSQCLGRLLNLLDQIMAARDWNGSHAAKLWLGKQYMNTSEDLSLLGRWRVVALLVDGVWLLCWQLSGQPQGCSATPAKRWEAGCACC